MKSLYFVMFHVFDRWPDDTVILISMSAASIKATYPEAKIVLLTNRPEEAAKVLPNLTTTPVDIDPASLMLERIREYRDFLVRAPADSMIVFCDTDILVLRRFDELFDDAVDLTVTVRRSRRGRINGGFYLVNTRRKEALISFFDRFVDAIKRLPAEKAFWYGDQLAIDALLQPSRLRRRRTVAGIHVRFVRGARYNCSPRSLALRFCLYPPFARVLHFKGRVKLHMGRYFERYVTQRIPPTANT